MRKFLILVSGVLFVFSAVGCSAPTGQKAAVSNKTVLKAKGIQVTIDEGGQFPEFLVGRWVQGDGWEFNFEPNGILSYIRHTLGGVEMKPYYIARVPVVGDKEAVFKPGGWFVDYTPSTRILTVQITVEDFNFPMGEGTLTGSSVDIFTGPVSKDSTIWQATLTHFQDYTVHTKELPNTKLPMRDPEGDVSEVIFEKVKE
ncbi:MAG: hypothetical protein ABSB91_02200 [Sedimentisphaerales bacterium]|jgi:hypothetical protein